MKVQPLADRVIVEPIEVEEKKGVIYIPDAAKEKPQQGKIIAVGEGRRNENNALTPLTLKPGDRVLYSKYGGTEIKLDGKDLLIMREDDVLGVLRA